MLGWIQASLYGGGMAPAVVGPLCVLCVGALVQMLLARLVSARTKGVLATAFSTAACGWTLFLVPFVHAGGAVDAVLGPWDGPLRIALHADALSALFASMATVVGTVVLLYSIGYMAHDRAATRFYFTMLMFIAGFVALVYCGNLFLLYLCWEIIGVCSFSLVGFWYTQADAVAGARKVLLMTHIAGYGLLLAVLILYTRAGTALWTDPAVGRSFSLGVFVLMLVAVMGKSVQFPLHTWIPDAMAAPTPVSSLLHAACYVTAGVYLAARMRSFGVWPAAWNTMVVTIATITILVGVTYAMVQRDLKRTLAFSTVSQIGYMLLGIGIGTPLGMTAGLLHCLNHGFFKGGLFLNAGAVQHACGTRDMDQLGGLAERMPRTTLCWLVGVGNMAGIPLMSGFVSKWMLYAAALEAGWAIPAVIAWIASLGTVFVCAKATSAVFLGPQTDCTRDAHEAPFTMRAGMELLALGSIVLGVAPQIAVVPLLQPMMLGMGPDRSLQVTWLGFFSGGGAFSTTGGLLMAVFSFVVGGTVVVLARMSRTPAGAIAGAGGGVFTGGEPLERGDRLSAGDFSLIFEQNWRTFFHWTNVDRVYAELVHEFRGASRLTAVPLRWLEKHSTAGVLLFAGTMLACVRFLIPYPEMAERAPGELVSDLLVGAVCIAAVTLIAAASESSVDVLLPLEMAVIAVLAVIGMMVGSEWERLFLLEGAAAFSVLPVWTAARTQRSRFTYLAVVVLSAGCLLGGEGLAEGEGAVWGRALLLTGVCVKVAILPFSFWVLRLADELPSPLLGLMIAVIDIAAAAEFSARAQADPGLLAPAWPWLVLAALTSLGAAMLMLAERSLKRLLVLSSIEDFGFLLLGVCAMSALGREGVLFAATSHALAKALLFVCLAGPERDEALHARPGLASEYPYSAFGFLVGMLAMLGLPPLLGYAGRWRLYEAALQVHPALLTCFVIASVIALIAYVSAFAAHWWGKAEAHADVDAEGESYSPRLRHEHWLTRASVVLLVTCLLLAGLWPRAILEAFQGGQP